ncbi:MAG: hypothetical protein ACP5TL_03385 [Candidatus Micrarchaeia archaeon]
MKSQATIDLLVSYGVAILIILAALYVLYRLGVFNPPLSPSFCTPAPSFMCDLVSINTSGAFTLKFAQATSGEINITGIACSTMANITTNGPMYGNVNLKGYEKAPYFYPTNQLKNGLIVYPSNNTIISAYCYGPGGVARGNYGNMFNGYIWINYTYAGLPKSMHNIEQIAVISTRYT